MIEYLSPGPCLTNCSFLHWETSQQPRLCKMGGVFDQKWAWSNFRAHYTRNLIILHPLLEYLPTPLILFIIQSTYHFLKILVACIPLLQHICQIHHWPHHYIQCPNYHWHKFLAGPQSYWHCQPVSHLLYFCILFQNLHQQKNDKLILIIGKPSPTLCMVLSNCIIMVRLWLLGFYMIIRHSIEFSLCSGSIWVPSDF